MDNVYELNGKKLSRDEVLGLVNPRLDGALNERVKRVLDVFDRDFESLLDIGCNTGNFLQLVDQLNPDCKKLCGVDCYEPAIKICKDFVVNEKINCFLYDCKNLPFQDGVFDVVTFFEVLEHVRDVDFFLKQVNKVLKKNGLIYLSVPNATWWRNVLKDIFLNKYTYAEKMHSWPEFSPDQKDHVNNFNFIHLYRILNLNGFKLDLLDYCSLSGSFFMRLPVVKNLGSTMILKARKYKEVW